MDFLNPNDLDDIPANQNIKLGGGLTPSEIVHLLYLKNKILLAKEGNNIPSIRTQFHREEKDLRTFLESVGDFKKNKLVVEDFDEEFWLLYLEELVDIRDTVSYNILK